MLGTDPNGNIVATALLKVLLGLLLLEKWRNYHYKYVHYLCKSWHEISMQLRNP